MEENYGLYSPLIQNEVLENCQGKNKHKRDPGFLASKFVFGFVPEKKAIKITCDDIVIS